ncbi:MAG TPA: LuxR C-terminal-related transcriptional regulator [Hyphomonas sp.]|nr:LuxR C-terminal-related transcriptional regulator [Hyphomonas sp.]
MLDLLRALLRAESVFDLRDSTMAAFAELGFSAAYYVSPVVQDRREGRMMINMGFPLEWERAYREAQRGSDPLPDIALRIGRSFRWGKLPEGVILQPSEAAYLKSLEQWGMADGIGIPAYGSAARVGFVGLGKPLKPDGFETADLDLLRIAAETSYLRYCELIVADADDIPRLSTRELDVLHWMAQGKSNAAIARQLELGQETVDTYVRRIFTKLNVSDRTSAVVKGVTRGLVIASEPKIDAAIQARQPRKTPEGGAE